ncbi:MAG: PQQ-binding-like beta-propeller repeat protein [Verrucomicrobiota bacterium]
MSASLGLLAQDKSTALQGKDFDKQSLALRTALHYDASLQAPLKSLIRLYEKAGRLEDLLALYRAHTSQYGEDAGAKVVMIRLLKALDRAEASEMVQSAAQQHVQHPGLKYLLYQDYKKRGDARALKTLSAAIDLQQTAGSRQTWIEELLAQAQENDERLLAERHLRDLLTAEGHSSATLLILAKQMHRYHFEELCLQAIKKAQEKKPDAETGVEIELLAARAEAGLGHFDAVAKRMDILLKRLAPDYHRRREIMKLRMSLVKNNADRDQLLEIAKLRYEKNPMNESAVLDYAELLSANEMRRRAAEVLVSAANRLPKSESLEKEALRLLDRLGDEAGMLLFLQKRLQGESGREDLQYRLVKAEYLAGKTVEARKRLEKIIAKLNKEERARRLLDLARYLRKRSQASDSAKLLEEVMQLVPARLDVQRELLETLLALEQRGKAEKLLASISMVDAEIENFVDLLQFMVQSDFLIEARDALEDRLKSEGNRLDLNLLLVTVLGKTGDRNKAQEVLMQSRASADTSARYAQWLQTGLDLYELLEQSEQFFDAEQFRFLEENKKWSPERVDRFLTLCELGEQKRLGSRVAQALRNQLADPALPGTLKVRLRLLLVKALDKSPDNAGEVEEQLELLAKEDGKRADDYQLRRALLYHSNSRPDLAKALLENLDMEKVTDESILRAAYLVFLEYSLVSHARVCLEKLSEMEPGDSAIWEKRLSLLAALGDEQELRVVLRRLFSGEGKMILKADTLQALRIHLLDSYWRSISQLLNAGDKESLGEVLVMLDSVEQDAGPSRDLSWSLWARAFALNRLQRETARDEVIKELKAFLKDQKSMIAFPDGLAMSLEAAESLLKTAQPEIGGKLVSNEVSEGPLGQLEMSWAFEADPGARILQISAAGEKAVLVLDDQGRVYKVDAQSGKLLWSEQYQLSAESTKTGQRNLRSSSLGGGGITISNSQFQVRQQGGSIMVRQLSAPYRSAQLGPGAGSGKPSYIAPGVKKTPSILVDAADYFFLSAGNQIRCYQNEDGALLWQSNLSEQLPLNRAMGSFSMARPDPVLFLDGDHLLCYAPMLDVASCFEKNTGKLLWSRNLGGGETGNALLYSLNSGATFSAGRLFVFGNSCQILDSTNGKTLWSFDDRGVQRFPLNLDRVREDEKQKNAAKPSAVDVAQTLPISSPLKGVGSILQAKTTFLAHSDKGDDLLNRMSQLKPFLQGKGALVAAAVQWNSLRGSGKGAADARLNGDRLLLMGDQSLQDISLSLPIGSKRYAVSGVLLGVAGDKLWFIHGAVLSQLSLSDGQQRQVKINEAQEEQNTVHAVMSGSRIYVSHGQGLTVLNAYNGRVINSSAWPELMADYLVKQSAYASAADGQGMVAWQGYVRSIPGRPAYCFPLRDKVHGERLFSMVNDSSFVMLRSRQPSQKAAAKK